MSNVEDKARAMNELDLYHDCSHIRQYRPGEWKTMLEAQGIKVDAIEPYTCHRPLSDLTKDVVPEDVALIHQTVAGRTEEERRKMHYAEHDGEPYINHWYVMVAGSR